MSEEGRNRLKELAAQVREKVSPSGAALLHRKGLLAVELLARDLSGSEGFPGIRLLRDAPSRFRLQRPMRNAELVVEWQREVGALSIGAEKHGEPRKLLRYVYEEERDAWRRMDGEQELYDDVAELMLEYLYPEGRA